MLLPIPDVLTAEQVLRARQLLDEADWVDGRVTAGHQSALTKDNMQLPEGSPAARELGGMVLSALEQNALFISAAGTGVLGLKMITPLRECDGAPGAARPWPLELGKSFTGSRPTR